MSRAILEARRVVLLDEASSSLDVISDSEMQQALRKAFGPEVTVS